jgi:Protein of unknown function (DUF4229)
VSGVVGGDRPKDADSAESFSSARDRLDQARPDLSIAADEAIGVSTPPPQDDLDHDALDRHDVDHDHLDDDHLDDSDSAETLAVVSSGTTAQNAERRAALRRQLLPPLLVYSLLRFGLTAVLTALLMLFVPFLIALVLAVILQLPLAILLFGPQRAKVNALTSELTAGRRAERDRLRTALRGDGVRLSDD